MMGTFSIGGRLSVSFRPTTSLPAKNTSKRRNTTIDTPGPRVPINHETVRMGKASFPPLTVTNVSRSMEFSASDGSDEDVIDVKASNSGDLPPKAKASGTRKRAASKSKTAKATSAAKKSELTAMLTEDSHGGALRSPDEWTMEETLDVSSSIDEATGSERTTISGPTLYVTRPLPKVLLIHTGGTLGMDPDTSFEESCEGEIVLKPGTGGAYGGLRPGTMLDNLLNVVPELKTFANLDLKVAFNKDSCRVGPPEWIKLAKILHAKRDAYDAFVIVHGTDTMSYTAPALSLLLLGFKKPIILTGSQLPLMMPRSDARQNLIDSMTCATGFFSPPHIGLQEVAVCFGGKLMRGNRCQKVDSSAYGAFDSPNYSHLARLGVDVDWNEGALLRDKGVYRPKFKLDPNVIRIPIVPGCDPRKSYGDLVGRGVKGVVLESFGVGNMPDTAEHGWLPWLKAQRKKGLQVYLASQCPVGDLHPELYHAGSIALKLGVEAGPQMTPETACVKMMMCLAHPDIPLGVALAGEM